MAAQGEAVYRGCELRQATAVLWCDPRGEDQHARARRRRQWHQSSLWVGKKHFLPFVARSNLSMPE